MTTVNLNQPILDKKNKPVISEVLDENGKQVSESTPFNPANHTKVVYTIGDLFIDALLGNYSGEEQLDGKIKKKRYKLYQKINLCPDSTIDLSPKEIVMLAELIEKGFTTIVVGQICEILGLEDDD